MPECIKCGHIFKGLGIMGTPWQNEKTGQWICRNCWGKLIFLDQEKYHKL